MRPISTALFCVAALASLGTLNASEQLARGSSSTNVRRHVYTDHVTQLTAAEYYQTAVMADQSGRFSDAQALYIEAIQLDPNNSHLCNDLGCSYVQSGNLALATRMFTRALGLDPNNTAARHNVYFARSLSERQVPVVRGPWKQNAERRVGLARISDNRIESSSSTGTQRRSAAPRDDGERDDPTLLPDEPWNRNRTFHYSLSRRRYADDRIFNVNFAFYNLVHRTPYAGFGIKLKEPLDLERGELLLTARCKTRLDACVKVLV